MKNSRWFASYKVGQKTMLVVLVFSLFACNATGQVQLAGSRVPAIDHMVAEVGVSQQRIVAIGDIHGDFDQLVKILRRTELIDQSNTWVGGDAHLVQLGDIPDRGPDSKKAMDLLMELEKTSLKSNGKVTVLIGNHDAMMMYDDLRYVHPGEYKAFVDKKSKSRQSANYKREVSRIKSSTPKLKWPSFDRAFKKKWKKDHPLGFAEHRLAWSATGTYGKWVLSRKAVAKVGSSLFTHGGLSPEFSDMPISEINTRVRTLLAQGAAMPTDSIVEDDKGPLWYRGWVTENQDLQNQQALELVLKKHGVNRMVIAHTPVVPHILPRFGGKLLLSDVGISKVYGSGFAAIEIVGDSVTSILKNSEIALPNGLYETIADGERQVDMYLDALEAELNDPSKVKRYRRIVEEAKVKSIAETANQKASQAQ